MRQRKILVIGASSAGKSTFIAERLLPELKSKGLKRGVDVQLSFAGELVRRLGLREPNKDGHIEDIFGRSTAASIIHYNLLMQFDFEPKLQQLELDREPLLKTLAEHSGDYQVYLVYAPEVLHAQRIKGRVEVEPNLREYKALYDSERVLSAMARVDQRQELLKVASMLAARSAKISVVLSLEDRFSIISLAEFRFGRPSAVLEKSLALD